MYSEDDKATCLYCGRETYRPVEIDKGDYTQTFCSEECAQEFENQPADEPTPLDILEYTGYW